MNDLEREVLRVAEEIANAWKGHDEGVELPGPSMEDLYIAVDTLSKQLEAHGKWLRQSRKPLNYDYSHHWFGAAQMLEERLNGNV